MSSQFTYYQAGQLPRGPSSFGHQQPEYVFNGSSWVVSRGNEHSYQSSHSSNYQKSATFGSAPGNGNRNGNDGHQTAWQPSRSLSPPGRQQEDESDPSAVIRKYSESYHYWVSMSKEQKRLADSLPPGNDKNEAERKAAWADYYAAESTRTVYEYKNKLTNSKPLPNTQSRASSFPSPSHKSENTPNKETRHSRSSRWKTAAPSQTDSPVRHDPKPSQRSHSEKNDKDTPESLRRYVHRCLKRCRNDDQRRQVQSAVEAKIQDACVAGNIETLDWDSMELVSPKDNRSPQESVSPIASHSNPHSTSYDNLKQPPLSSPLSSHSTQNHNSLSPVSKPASHSKKAKRSTTVDRHTPTENTLGTPMKNKSRQALLSLLLSPNSSVAEPSLPSDIHPSSSVGKTLPSEDKEFASEVTVSSSFITKPVSSVPKGSNTKLPEEHPKESPRSTPKSQEGEQEYIPLSDVASHPKKRKRKKEFSGADGFCRSSSILEHRANRFSGRGGIKDVQQSDVSSARSGVDRFMGKSLIGGGGRQLDETDYEQMTVKGTCQVLEKDYLRLTSPPIPELVRPQPILEKHLRNLKKAWKAARKRGSKGDSSSHDHKEYVWFCSQFKALRQDLTVQRIHNAFTVSVYETHARIALEEGDLNEYNQCQTQLKYLYDNLRQEQAKQNIFFSKGSGLENENEFIAYRIIYYVFLTLNKKYEGGSSDLFRIMLSLGPEHLNNEGIQHALDVRVAVAENNYHNFFRLLQSCPRMGFYLMNQMVPSIRQAALLRIQRTYRPSVPVAFVLQELGFHSDESVEGKDFLRGCGCKLNEDETTFLTKESTLGDYSQVTKKSSLI